MGNRSSGEHQSAFMGGNALRRSLVRGTAGDLSERVKLKILGKFGSSLSCQFNPASKQPRSTSNPFIRN